MTSGRSKTNNLFLTAILTATVILSFLPIKTAFSVEGEWAGQEDGAPDPAEEAYQQAQAAKAEEVKAVDKTNTEEVKTRTQNDQESFKAMVERIKTLREEDHKTGEDVAGKDNFNERKNDSKGADSGSFVPVIEQSGQLLTFTKNTSNDTDYTRKLNIEICRYIKTIKRVQQMIEYKEFVADPDARMQAATEIEKYKAAQYKFVNEGWDSDGTGDKKMPLYPLNYSDHYKNIADEQTNVLTAEIQKDAGEEKGKILFSDDINRIATKEIQNQKNDLKRLQSTIGKQDITNFLDNKNNDPSKDAVAFRQMLRPENNMIGSYYLRKEILASRQVEALSNAQQELSNNGGFMSVRKCADDQIIEQDGKKYCKKYETITPGAIVRNSAENANSARINQYIQAREVGDVTPGNEPIISETQEFKPAIIDSTGNGGGNKIPQESGLGDQLSIPGFNLDSIFNLGNNETDDFLSNRNIDQSWLESLSAWIGQIYRVIQTNTDEGNGGETNTSSGSGAPVIINLTRKKNVLWNLGIYKSKIKWEITGADSCYAKNNWLSKNQNNDSKFDTLFEKNTLISMSGDVDTLYPLPKAKTTFKIYFQDDPQNPTERPDIITNDYVIFNTDIKPGERWELIYNDSNIKASYVTKDGDDVITAITNFIGEAKNTLPDLKITASSIYDGNATLDVSLNADIGIECKNADGTTSSNSISI